ncbi:hypothetical protein GV055_04820 [Marinomonas mediterranea]|nr:hypothetical protein GV055_04820 [Marinomonas mediterranea]WCN15422.1 hypothetical protein GV054_04665 [Marinomonas mediterranea]WCN19484.1 hypothetical protein GV053_04795 [Marinomonas mediterranea MMB-1]
MHRQQHRDSLELSYHDISECHITYSSAQELLSRLSSLNINEDIDFINSAEWIGNQLRKSLPVQAVKSIEDFAQNNSEAALIIRGLPLGGLIPPTPYDGFTENKNLVLANALHIGIYHLAGYSPIAYKNENNGKLFRHVVPAKQGKGQKSSHGSDLTFGFHVDNPDLPLSPEPIVDKSACPELLSLMAIRSDLKVKSSIVILDNVLANLNRAVIQTLCTDEYMVERPASFDIGQSSRLPILTYDENNIPYCRYDKENISPLTPKAAAALLMLEAELEKQTNQITTVFCPGDMLLIKNQRTLHRREAYQARNDGSDRWLIRLFGAQSLDRIIPVNTFSHIGQD